MKVSIKLGDLELRGNDDGDEILTMEILNQGANALARWYQDGHDYNLRFNGRLPFFAVGCVQVIMKDFWTLIEIGQHLIEGTKA